MSIKSYVDYSGDIMKLIFYGQAGGKMTVCY